MKRTLVSIFTEAGSQTGYGHFTRCLALAQGFEELGIQTHLNIISDQEIQPISSKCISLKTLNWLEWIPSPDSDITNIAIVDSYNLNINKCDTFLKLYNKVLFLDDLNSLTYPSGFLVNGMIGAEHLPYPRNSHLNYMLGSSYQPLRKPFWTTPKRSISKEINNILITFGGSDVSNETPKTIEWLRGIFHKAKLYVVIGSGFSSANVLNIEALINNKMIIEYAPDAKKMYDLMCISDLAISAAGQSISELACCGVPTYAIQVVDNQKNNMENWIKSNFLLSLNEINFQIDYNLRKEKAEIGQQIIDGQGVRRIVKCLL